MPMFVYISAHELINAALIVKADYTPGKDRNPSRLILYVKTEKEELEEIEVTEYADRTWSDLVPRGFGG